MPAPKLPKSVKAKAESMLNDSYHEDLNLVLKATAYIDSGLLRLLLILDC